MKTIHFKSGYSLKVTQIIANTILEALNTNPRKWHVVIEENGDVTYLININDISHIA